MRKEDRIIAAAAAAAKHKAGQLVDGAAGLATTAVTAAANDMHRAGDALVAASLKLEKAVDAAKTPAPRALKLVD